MSWLTTNPAGGGYEPELVDIFLTNAEKLLAGLDGPVDRETILALEPEPHSMLDEEACEEAFLAIADMIDMRRRSNTSRSPRAPADRPRWRPASIMFA
jgi:hypothetical protein